MKVAQGKNTLILAPLSPSGLDAYLNRVASSCPADPDLMAISYTQPPYEWASAWKAYVGTLPDRNVFIKGGSISDDEAHGFDRVLEADPTDPMSVVVPVEEQLAAWESTDADTVVSLQTLSVLLQYIGSDTLFRYLNLVTHKVRAVNARGYYQMDPELHDQATVNTLKVLFDTVETIPEDELTDRRDAQTTPGEHGPSAVDQLVSLYESSRSRIADALRPATRDAANEAANEPAVDATADTSDDDPTGVGEELLTDGERIRRLLLQSGGQMRQTALVSTLPWSSSTVSRKLTELEKRGEVSRIQVGRGKVVFHPESEPEAAKSPFEKFQSQPQVSE